MVSIITLSSLINPLLALLPPQHVIHVVSHHLIAIRVSPISKSHVSTLVLLLILMLLSVGLVLLVLQVLVLLRTLLICLRMVLLLRLAVQIVLLLQLLPLIVSATSQAASHVLHRSCRSS